MRIQSVSDIEKALENLDAKKTAIEARAVEIAEQQKRLGFVAMIGRDKSATASLAQLNTEASAIDGALEGLSAAIAGGQQQLALARAAEANLADQQEARELAEALEVFTACGNEIDAALENSRNRAAKNAACSSAHARFGRTSTRSSPVQHSVQRSDHQRVEADCMGKRISTAARVATPSLWRSGDIMVGGNP